MRPDPAEIVRTLSAGHLPAVVHTTADSDCYTAPSGVDEHGSPLLLSADSGPLTAALRGHDGLDTAIALRFDDEPPMPCAPSLGTAWLSGWVVEVPEAERRQAAVDFSRTQPLPELLDVGNGFTLWRVEVAEIRWEGQRHRCDVAEEDFRAAEGDPWYGIEVELLLDLYDHHPEVLDALTKRMRRLNPSAHSVRPLRINRHGLTIDVHDERGGDLGRYLVAHHSRSDDLEQVLHGLTCCRCLDQAQIEH